MLYHSKNILRKDFGEAVTLELSSRYFELPLTDPATIVIEFA